MKKTPKPPAPFKLAAGIAPYPKELLPKRLARRKETTDIITHCTGGDQSGQTLELYDKLHRSKKWAMFGYHFYIRKSGKIFQGRPLWAVGSHTKPNGMNRLSIGICLEGLNKFTEAQCRALIWLKYYLRGIYGDHLKMGTHRFHDPKRRTCPHWTGRQFAAKIGYDPFDYDLEGYVNPDEKAA